MRVARAVVGAAVLAGVLVGVRPAGAAGGGVNDASCRSSRHPVPVVLLHGLGANKSWDIDQLQKQLAEADYCTFSVTYGTDPRVPFFGGVIRVRGRNDARRRCRARGGGLPCRGCGPGVRR